MDAKQANSLRELIETMKISDEDKAKLLQNILQSENQKLNILITGATGCGKSSTINALFGTEKAKVGCTPDPETMSIEKYDMGSLILWDSPGLGDGKESDNRHAKNIINKLYERDANGDMLIDLVLVILDGSSRDLGTSYQLINEVIIPNLGEDKENRILVAINQADVAMKGRYWNYEENKPEPKLVEFLDEKAASVKKRIKEATGVNIDPIYYSAGFKEEGEEQSPPYNLSKLLYYIVKRTPKKKRLIYTQKINQDETVWKDNDSRDYGDKIRNSFMESVLDGVSNGADVGAEFGKAFGKVGEVVGRVIGGVVGGFVEGAKHVFSGGGGCYITTATCEEYGKPDDCYELTAFRGFRDNWLKNQPDGQQLIDQYYATAPAIVEQINKQENRADIYRHIHDAYLSKCLTFIENNENEKCKDLYVSMMEYLYEEQKNWQ